MGQSLSVSPFPSVSPSFPLSHSLSLKSVLKIKKKKEKQLVTYKITPVRLSADFSTETFQARRNWHKIFQVMKSKDLGPRLLYLARLLFRIKGQTKCFSEKKLLEEFVTPKPVSQEMLKELL